MALLALLGCLAVRGGRRSGAGADLAKADYLYLEALRSKALDRPDAAYELLARAHQLNPADLGIQSELAGFMLLASRGDSAQVADAVAMLRRAYRDNPEYYAGIRLALLDESLGQDAEALAVWRELHALYPDRAGLTMRLADVLAQGRDSLAWAEAMELYQGLERSEGHSVQLTGKQIQLIYQASPSRPDTAAVLGLVQRLLDTSPRSVDFNVFAGDVLDMFGRGDSALAMYDRAVALDPASGLAVYARANHYNAMGDTVAYDREVFRSLGLDDLDFEVKAAILRDYVSKPYADTTQRQRICGMFDRLIVLHPNEGDLHQMYSQYFLATSDWGAAAEQVERALDLEPDNEPLWEMLVSLYIQVDDYPGAAAAGARALRLFPDEAQLHYMSGSVAVQTDSLDAALAHYRRALALADEDDYELRSNLHASMGDVFQLREQPDSVRAHYDVAIEGYPGNLLALNNYAYYLACANTDLDRALEMVERAVDGKPDDPTTLDTYAWVLFRRKDYDKARQTIDKALEGYDDPSYEILAHAGDICFMAGEPDRAVEFWQRALDMEPGDELLRRKVKHKTYFYK